MELKGLNIVEFFDSLFKFLLLYTNNGVTQWGFEFNLLNEAKFLKIFTSCSPINSINTKH